MLSVMYQEFMAKMREKDYRQDVGGSRVKEKPSLPKKGKESHCYAHKKPKSRFLASSHAPSPSLYRRTMIDSACAKNNHHIHCSTSVNSPSNSVVAIL